MDLYLRCHFVGFFTVIGALNIHVFLKFPLSARIYFQVCPQQLVLTNTASMICVWVSSLTSWTQIWCYQWCHLQLQWCHLEVLMSRVAFIFLFLLSRPKKTILFRWGGSRKDWLSKISLRSEVVSLRLQTGSSHRTPVINAKCRPS